MTYGLILIALSAIAKVFMDLCKINAFPDSWTWWNERTSWANKDKWEEKLLGRQNDLVEAIFHTVLVWVTDGWHFFQMLFLNLLFVGALMPFMKWYWVLLIIAGYKIIFQTGYSLLKLILK